MNIPIQAHYGYLLGPVVVAKGPHPVSLLAFLVEERPGVKIAGDISIGHLTSLIVSLITSCASSSHTWSIISSVTLQRAILPSLDPDTRN